MIGEILPATVAAAESFGDPTNVRLLPGEEAAVARAVEKRRREYATVRHCARLALTQLGRAPAAILTGPHREPLWPAGIVGSLTHCDGYRAAALTPDTAHLSVGIDAESHAPLPADVFAMIARPVEVSRLAQLAAAHPEVHWDRLLFSAKESIYKAWYPLAQRWLGFEEATLEFDADAGAFTAELHQTGPLIGDRPLTAMRGRWLIADGLVLTSVVVDHPS